jgi:hypothetical protein
LIMTRNDAEKSARTIRIDIEEDVKRGTYATVEEGLTDKLVAALMALKSDRRVR